MNATAHAARATMRSVRDPLKENASVMNVAASMSLPLDYRTMGHSVTALRIHRPAGTPLTLQYDIIHMYTADESDHLCDHFNTQTLKLSEHKTL